MADITNKTLSLFLLAAIMISVGGVLVMVSRYGTAGITGRLTDTDTGVTNFSINQSLSIIFNQNLVPFGLGYVNDSNLSCIMGTNASPPNLPGSGCVGFNTTVNASNLTIENDGNIYANVSINFTKNATTFIGGTSPSFMYQVRNAEASSCQSIPFGSSFRQVAGNDTNITMSKICRNMTPTDTSDLIDIAIWVSIPKDAATGAHTVTITALACDDSSC